MIEVKGKYNNAKIFTDVVESEAISQIIDICNQKAFCDSKIRIMPDVHAGKGCTIGTTMTITDKVVPNLVGADVGCGMEVVDIGSKDIDFEKLDGVIRNNVPSGFDVRDKIHPYIKNINLDSLYCRNFVNMDRAIYSLGTLGGGNHFIEIDEDDGGNKYLVIHSGSRNLGVGIAKYYQDEAYKRLAKKSGSEIRNQIIEKLKSEGKQGEISEALKNLYVEKIQKDFAYCECELFEQIYDKYMQAPLKYLETAYNSKNDWRNWEKDVIARHSDDIDYYRRWLAYEEIWSRYEDTLMNEEDVVYVSIFGQYETQEIFCFIKKCHEAQIKWEEEIKRQEKEGKSL